jgi:hypothetical protein
LPPQLPTSSAYARAASRVELVDLVISERSRAEKVRRLYVEIDELLRGTRRQQLGVLLEIAAGKPTAETEAHAAVTRVQEAELSALRRYIELQLELRRSTSPEEFARLDAIK